MSIFLRPGWRLLVAALLLLALPLQAAELARMVVCPPAASSAGHEHAPGLDDAGAHHHDDLQAAEADLAEGDLQTGSHTGSQTEHHAHAGSSCCKTCLAGCGGWVLATPLDWPAPGWTMASFPRLTTASGPEPLPRGLERPPRTSTA